ncbi:MAG TPA: ABC transporter substrate binding protein, partial [Burkholderiales bacterium]|nr:ABC transporter substrate binding protein [Burkholderiales bacterium]
MNRRRFASGLAAVSLAMPFSLRAQQPARLRRVAIVGIGDLEKFPLSSVVKGMRELGYHDGRNVEYFRPIARGSYEDLAGLATAAVNRQAEVIVTYGSTATAAVKAATRDIPIVMLLGVDPVRLGFVGNLARPEGNITGIVTGTRLLAAKQVELVKDAVPGARRLAVLWSATSATQADTLKIVEAAATRLGLVVVPIEVNRPDDLKTLSTALSKARADVLLTIGTAMLTARRDEVVGIVA